MSVASFWNSRDRQERWEICFLTFVTTTVFLTFYQPLQATRLSGTDDNCYLQWLYRFLFVEPAPSCYMPGYYPGTAILWIPAGAVARALSAIFGLSVDTLLHRAVAVTSFLCLPLSLYPLCLIAKGRPEVLRSLRINPMVLATLILLSSPILSFFTAGAMMAHAAEMLLVSWACWAILNGHFPIAILLSAWAVITRINDWALLTMLAAAMWTRMRAPGKPLSKGVLIAGGVIGGSVMLQLGYMAFFKGYLGVETLFSSFGTGLTLERILMLFFSSKYGLLWTAPWWLMVFSVGIMNLHRLSLISWGALGWGAFMLIYCSSHTNHDGSYGFRYFIGTFLGLFLVWLELLEKVKGEWFRKYTVAALIFSASWVTYLHWLAMSRNPLSVAMRYPNWMPYWQFGIQPLLESPSHIAVRLSHSPIGVVIWSWVGSLAPHLLPKTANQPLVGEAKWLLSVVVVLVVALWGLVAHRLWRMRAAKGLEVPAVT